MSAFFCVSAFFYASALLHGRKKKGCFQASYLCAILIFLTQAICFKRHTICSLTTTLQLCEENCNTQTSLTSISLQLYGMHFNLSDLVFHCSKIKPYVIFISLNNVGDKHYSQQLPQRLKHVAGVEYYNTVCYLPLQSREFIIEQISF